MTAPVPATSFDDIYQAEYRRLLRKLRRRAAQDAAGVRHAPGEAHELQGDCGAARYQPRHGRLSYGAGARAVPRRDCSTMLAATRVGQEPETDNAKCPDITGKSGSPSVSFEAFYRAEHARVLCYFRRKAGRDDAPDLTQEAFMRLYGSGKFADLEYPRAYLTRIAHNIWLNRLRQQKRRGILYPFDEACDAPTAPEQERWLEAKDLRRAYWRALRPLSRKTRRIFLMHRLRGMTYRDIADELGMSCKAVEKRIGRALARCRRVAALRHG